MRIERRDGSADRSRQLRTDIGDAALCTGVEGRVCGAQCTVKCPSCGSTGCQCQCAPGCADAPSMMSVDPDYPIEPGIAPLVFEMKRLGLFRPCWSCEGHMKPAGGFWKPPRVWFYCDSTVHLRLLDSGIARLKQAGKLKAPWQVAVTYSDDDNPETTFSLEPVPGSENTLPLAARQNDAAEIARALQDIMTSEARLLQREIGGAFHGNN